MDALKLTLWRTMPPVCEGCNRYAWDCTGPDLHEPTEPGSCTDHTPTPAPFDQQEEPISPDTY